jgi:hypothetical protein
VEAYFRSNEAYVSPWLGQPLQPSRGLSTRNDAGTGWVLRNINGFLAYVGDDGNVMTVEIDVPDTILASGEAERGTTAEQFEPAQSQGLSELEDRLLSADQPAAVRAAVRELRELVRIAERELAEVAEDDPWRGFYVDVLHKCATLIEQGELHLQELELGHADDTTSR